MPILDNTNESHLKRIIRDAVSRNWERNKLWETIEDMVNMEWNLPGGVVDIPGVHKVVTSDAHDAVRAATRILSSIAPKIKLFPLHHNEETKQRAEEMEGVLRWFFRSLNKRSNASVLRDLVRSAVLYDCIAFQTVFIPVEIAEGRMSEAKAASVARKGPFSWRLHNPRTVYPIWGDDELEAVVIVKVQTLSQFLSAWGEKGSAAIEVARRSVAEGKDMPTGNRATATAEFQRIAVYDFWDSEVRYVAVAPMWNQLRIDDMAGDAVAVMEPTPHGYEFLPWVVVSGGTNLAPLEEDRYEPMLVSAARTGQWESANVMQTLIATEAIANFRAPTQVLSGPDPVNNIVETNEQLNNVVLATSGHTVQPMPKPQLDTNLLTLAQQYQQAIGQSTVNNALRGGGPEASTFAAANLQTKTGLFAISPYKTLAEEAIEEGLTQMLLWIHYEADGPFPSYGWDERTGLTTSPVTVDPDEIAPDAIYLQVSLKAEAPLDSLQQANAANLARNFGLPKERALEQIGITDPQRAIQENEAELIREVIVGIEIQKLQQQAQMEMQQLQQAQEQAAQAAAMQQQQAAGGGIEGIGGQGFNPAMGGVPPGVASPEGATFEGQTLQTRGGAPL